jgi:hypothetical protein
MATQFPTNLDNFTNPLPGDKLNSPSHSTQHTNANDAIEAIEAVIGVTGSTDPNTITGSLSNKVPYTGAIANVNLGENGISSGFFQADLTPSSALQVGRMQWNDADGTMEMRLKGNNVTLQIGQEQLIRVVNKTGADLLEANYQCVKISGAQGQRPKVALAQANNDANSADTIGLVTETIANNQEGFVTDAGIVSNINTTGSLQGETWADGDVLYLSGTTAGRLTNVKPQAPIHTVIVGFVIYAHNNQGKIYVKVDNGYELNELHNVKIVSPTNNQILQYTSATGLWENKTASFASGTVTSVSGTGSYGGLSLTGTVTSSGSLTFGGTPTGTWPIGVTGNAGTVTNGVYTTGDQTIGGVKTFTSSVDAPSFRDSANTAYYLDPANTGTSMVVAGKVAIGNTATPDGKVMVTVDGAYNGSVASRTAIQLDNTNATGGFTNSRIQWTWGGFGTGIKGYIEGGTYGSDYLSFGFNTTERMRIESNGSVGINRVPDSGMALDVGGEVRIINAIGGDYGGAFRLYNSSAGATNPAKHFRISSNGTLELINSAYNAIVFSFTDSGYFYAGEEINAKVFRDIRNSAYYLDPLSTGTSLNVAGSIVAAGNVTAYSDIRVKDNVENITDAIGKLNQIRGVTYTRTDLDDKQRRFAGVIAQEIEQVLPEAVFDNGKVKAVDYNATIALLIEAVKEQQKRIDKLETLLNKGN